MPKKTDQEIIDTVDNMDAVQSTAKVLVWQDMGVDEKKKIYTSLCLTDIETLIDESTERIKNDACFCAGNTDMPLTTNLWTHPTTGDLYLKDRQDLPNDESMMTLVFEQGQTITDLISAVTTKLTTLQAEINNLVDVNTDVDGDGYRVIEELLSRQ